MENASKALIIAGAILLAIVIISLGLIVVNNVRNTVDTSNLNEQEIMAFNSKFTAYEGEKVSGSRVNSLIQQVISSNQELSDKGSDKFIIIAFLPKNKTKYYYLTYNATSKSMVSRIGGDATGTSSVPPVTYVPTPDSSYKTDNMTGLQLSVNTGTNYVVNLYYKDGMVRYIRVV